MVRFSYDHSEINAETARAIVGKKLAHVITTAETLQEWTSFFNVEVSVFSTGSKNITISECKQYDCDGKTYRVEKYIHVTCSNAGEQGTSARVDTFEHNTMKLIGNRVVYLDWIIPGAKKLEQIIRKTF